MSLISSDLNQERATMTSVKPDVSKTSSVQLVEIRNGKVVFKQKPISLENLSETMQEIVTFREYFESLDTPLSEIPDDHLPLIAKLVHESDKSISALTKALRSLLLPPALDAPSQPSGSEAPCYLASSTIEQAIKTVAERVNYGVNTHLDKQPVALYVWRWEVRNREWLPKSVREKACQRLHERVAAKKYLQGLFDALPGQQKDAILQPKPSKEPTGLDGIEENAPKSAEQIIRPETSGSRESSTKKPGRHKKFIEPEVIAKEKERQERKATKAEKEKKVAEATKKSAAAFANFFKAGASAKPGKPLDTIQSQISAASSSSNTGHLSEFQLTFKPFVIKKDAHVAPINWFIAQRHHHKQKTNGVKGKYQQDIIEIDDEGQEVQMRNDRHVPMDVDVDAADISHLDPRDVVQSFLDSKPPSLHPVSRAFAARRRFKAEPQYSVRRLMGQINDAEVQGDQRVVRKFTGFLNDRQKIPVKVLIFAENNRPGYLGTWTGTAMNIGPRTPFARESLTFDYDHDSDAEWEEEEAEGGVDDVDSLNGSIEAEESSSEADMDDWLVEGDEIEIENETTSVRTETNQSPVQSGVKRRETGSHEAQHKRRKVIPLIPFQKGPVWEKELGNLDYEPFKSMRIRLFNDTPFPLDPFTFVSKPIVCEKSTSKDADPIFVVPALPGRLLSTLPMAADSLASIDDSRAKRRAANPTPPPKTSFPDAHVPLLLQKIDASNTNSFAVLLDSLFQDLKSHGIKKNALEVKLREVSEKDKTKKGWVVKEHAWVQYGLIKPT